MAIPDPALKRWAIASRGVADADTTLSNVASLQAGLSIFFAEEFHDIAGPVDYSLLPPWVIVCLGLVGLILLGLIVWWIRRRWQRPKPQLSPRERTLELLDRISREIDTLPPYQFSIRVSDILRRYVTEQYDLPVTRQTSVEFLNALAQASPFSEDEKSLLEDFLNRCDLIKFARYDATKEDSRLLLEEATRFVQGGKLEPA
jgi:hypothetical protein